MTKLTTERLEEIAKLEITEFSDGMDIAKDAYQSVGSSEIVLMARQLLAYEQADKTTDLKTLVISEIVDFYSGFESPGEPETVDEAQRQLIGRVENVFGLAAPVLPKQPEFYTKPDRFLPKSLKPEEISGERRNSRIAELMGWFDRYYSGKANPKWLKSHVAELCYYILTVPQLSAQPVSEPYKLPSGYALVPCKLTAENGAKSCMIGEFTEQTEISCPECFGDDECETCDGSGMIEVTVPVSWTTIKDIWAKGIEHFAAAPAQESE